MGREARASGSQYLAAGFGHRKPERLTPARARRAWRKELQAKAQDPARLISILKTNTPKENHE